MAELQVNQDTQEGQIEVTEYVSDGEDIDVSSQDTVTVELAGGAGGRPAARSYDGDYFAYQADASQAPGLGGGVEVEIDVSSIDTLSAVVGEGYPARELSGVATNDFDGEEQGAVGYFDGGDGGEYPLPDADGFSKAGGGGGSTALLDGDGNVLVHADGGGGGSSIWGDGDSDGGDSSTVPAGGGGGARGGAGGDSAYDSPGSDGEGTGNGGDGAGQAEYDDNPEFAYYPGEDGGYEIVDTDIVTELTTTSSSENGFVNVSVTVGTAFDETLEVLSYQKNEKHLEQSNARVQVLRNEWLDVLPDLDKLYAEFTVVVDGTDDFGGRLVDYVNRKSVVELELGTYEEDVLNSEPTPAIDQYNGVEDSSIVEDAITAAQSVSQGTIETISSDVSFIFSNASYAKVIREVQRTTGAFVQYQPDKNVDYVQNPGSDRSGSLTIGPAQQNVSESFEVVEDEREEITHVRVLGSQEGQARIQAEAVVSDYLSGTQQSWKKYKDKEITDESRAQEVANMVISEYENSPRKLEVQTRIFDEQITIGDIVRVKSDIDNIDDNLQVVELTSILDGGEFVYDVTLSNRLLTRDNSAEKRRRDVEKFNEAFQGDIVNPTVGVRNAIGANGSFEFKFRKPDDVVKELSETILVETSDYRAYNSDGVDQTNELATDIDVYVNDVLEIEGATVAYTDFAFDVTGSFDEGFNDIRLENNDSEAADVQVVVFTDYYRQIVDG